LADANKFYFRFCCRGFLFLPEAQSSNWAIKKDKNFLGRLSFNTTSSGQNYYSTQDMALPNFVNLFSFRAFCQGAKVFLFLSVFEVILL